MCKSLAEGGQRCAHHTRARLQKAAERLQALAAQGNPEAFDKAREVWETAAVEYASTPGGHAALTAQRGQATDSHTVAMLGSILRRGEVMREANEDIKATLALASYTASSLPEAPMEPMFTLAPDENGNPLTGEDEQTWTSAMQYAIDKYGDGDGWNTYKIESLERLDQTVASAESNDAALAAALDRVAMGFNGYHREIDAGFAVQVRRAMEHPNAGDKVFEIARHNQGMEAALSHPNIPSETVLSTLHMVKSEQVSEETWGVLNERSQKGDVGVALAVARAHPDQYAREDAVSTLAGADYTNMSPSTFRTLMNEVPKLPASHDVKTFMLDSMETHLRYYPDVEKSATAMATLRQSKEQLQAQSSEHAEQAEPGPRWRRARKPVAIEADSVLESVLTPGTASWPRGGTLD